MATKAITLSSRSPEALLKALRSTVQPFSAPEKAILFTLSSNTQNGPLLEFLNKLNPRSAGCLSASPDDIIRCSVAAFDASQATIFRSTIAGRRAPQVGRWHAFRDKNDVGKSGLDDEDVLGLGSGTSVHWEDVWKRSTQTDALPEGLQSLKPEDVSSVVYFTDSASEGLSNALTALPSAVKLGLVASSTPFITGRPVTLFHDGEIHGDGAVGIALTGSSAAPKASLNFAGLTALTPKMIVTKSEGNLVNALDDKNPSKLLLDAIKKGNITDHHKEDAFYLATFNDSNPDELNQVYHITSGDPGRGTIALESHAAPLVGTKAQIFHRAGKTKLGGSSQKLASNSFTFTTASLPDMVPGTSNESDESVNTEDAFHAFSENGFILSRGAELAWKCTVDEGSAELRWQ